MAKRKKSRAHQVSKGERSNVNKKVCNAMRSDISMLQRTINQREAWMRGKNVMVTIPNPNDKETNKRFIRVNAKDIWGSPKKYIMKQSASE
tara:strand:- start:78 stop:350 length:273 start_codon:yes stop_codon:yes gene_type:complete